MRNPSGVYSSEIADDYWENLFSFYRRLFEVKRRFSFEAMRKKVLTNETHDERWRGCSNKGFVREKYYNIRERERR